MRRVLFAALLSVIVGCSSSALRWTPQYYVVAEGDTLYSIAWRYDLDPQQLAAWNGLGSGKLIYPGQKIRLSAPSGGSTRAASSSSRQSGSGQNSKSAKNASTPPSPPARPARDWQWPTAGAVIATYGATPKTRSGIQIGGRRGQAVAAAGGGKIVYSGSGLTGYGQLVIIKHNDNYLSAYGHNESLLVTEGQQVNKGQQIARMGLGPGKRPLLHFEIRFDGAPVDPLNYLPRR